MDSGNPTLRAAGVPPDSRTTSDDAQDTPPAKLTRSEERLIEARVEILGAPPTGSEIAYLHAVLAQLSLPRRKIEAIEYECTVGPDDSRVSLRLEAGKLWCGELKRWVQQPLPYGALSRLIWIRLFSDALLNGPEIDVGPGPTAFAKRITGAAIGGKRGNLRPLRGHIAALAAVRMQLGISYGDYPTTYNGSPIQRFDGWVAPTDGEPRVWPCMIEMDPSLYKSLREHGVPLDLRAIRALQGSALALDIYCWLAHRLYRVREPVKLYWKWHLHPQFGHGYADEREFGREFRNQLRRVLEVYPDAKVVSIRGGLKISHSPTPVPAKDS